MKMMRQSLGVQSSNDNQFENRFTTIQSDKMSGLQAKRCDCNTSL